MDTELVALLSPIVMGLVEVSKRVGVPARFLPLVSLGFGIILSLIYGLYNDIGSVDMAFSGIVAGLLAVGLYSGGKAIAGN